MKICNKMNKTRSHMTIFFPHMIAAICKILQMMNSAKLNFGAGKKERKYINFPDHKNLQSTFLSSIAHVYKCTHLFQQQTLICQLSCPLTSPINISIKYCINVDLDCYMYMLIYSSKNPCSINDR